VEGAVDRDVLLSPRRAGPQYVLGFRFHPEWQQLGQRFGSAIGLRNARSCVTLQRWGRPSPSPSPCHRHSVSSLRLRLPAGEHVERGSGWGPSPRAEARSEGMVLGRRNRRARRSPTTTLMREAYAARRRPRGRFLLPWTATRPLVRTRVRVDGATIGAVRLVQAVSNGSLRCAIDILVRASYGWSTAQQPSPLPRPLRDRR
jgi:hypothetical protein